MTDRLLAVLDAEGRWGLTFDRLQWIVARRNRADGSAWAGCKYVTRKARLFAALADLGIAPTPAARAVLDRLPDSHALWRCCDPEGYAAIDAMLDAKAAAGRAGAASRWNHHSCHSEAAYSAIPVRPATDPYPDGPVVPILAGIAPDGRFHGTREPPAGTP